MDVLNSLLPLLIIIGVIAFVFIFMKNQSKKKRAIIQGKIDEVNDFFNKLNKQKSFPVINSHMLLKKGEKGYLQDNAELYEIRAMRKSDRGGGAVRVAKGVYIGGSSGTSRSYDELRKIDNGKLLLTNLRLIFDGNLNTRDIKLDKILSVSGYSDGIEIAVEGKSKGQVYKGMYNPFLWKALIYYVRQIPESGELPIANVEVDD